MTRRVVEIYPSAWFTTADVLVTECRHRHVRPKGVYTVGSTLVCTFCELNRTFLSGPNQITVLPDIGSDVPGGGAV